MLARKCKGTFESFIWKSSNYQWRCFWGVNNVGHCAFSTMLLFLDSDLSYDCDLKHVYAVILTHWACCQVVQRGNVLWGFSYGLQFAKPVIFKCPSNSTASIALGERSWLLCTCLGVPGYQLHSTLISLQCNFGGLQWDEHRWESTTQEVVATSVLPVYDMSWVLRWANVIYPFVIDKNGWSGKYKKNPLYNLNQHLLIAGSEFEIWKIKHTSLWYRVSLGKDNFSLWYLSVILWNKQYGAGS